jgi:hypothetical protein
MSPFVAMGVLGTVLLVIVAIELTRRIRDQERRDEDLCREVLAAFERVRPKLRIPDQYEAIHTELRAVHEARSAGQQIEENARAALPSFLPPAPEGQDRDVTLSRVSSFLTNEPLLAGVGAGEQFFYALFDSVSDTAFAGTVEAIIDQAGDQMMDSVREAAQLAAPAAGRLAHMLMVYYQENKGELIDFLYDSFELVTRRGQDELFSFVAHVFDAEHLRLYSEAFGPVVQPLIQGLEKSASFAGGELAAVDVSSFDDAVAPDFSFPVVTAILSSVRELQLLDSGKTELADSIKNAGLDVVGTGIGGGLGAKAGALIGTALAPGVGTLICGAIGAVGGALGGRFATNRIKLAPFRAAHAAHVSIVALAERNTADAARDLQNCLGEVASSARARLEDKLQRLPLLAKSPRRLGEEAARAAALAQSSIDLERQNLRKQHSSALAELPRNRWHRTFWGGGPVAEASAALQSLLIDRDRDLYNLAIHIPRPGDCQDDPFRYLEVLTRTALPESDELGRSLSRCVQETKLSRASYLAGLVVWAQDFAFCYQVSAQTSRRTFQDEADRFQALCKEWSQQATASKEEARRELDKLGAS